MTSDPTTRDELHRVAVHIVARARLADTGRFSLRATPNGFGTPELGPDNRRVRVAGAVLVVESDRPGGAGLAHAALGGATLRQVATVARVDLTAPIDVGHDTPPLGDPDRPLAIDPTAADDLGAWFGAVAIMLDRVATSQTPQATPTLPRLWPEHFDLAIDTAARPGRRVNLGGSPGDRYCEEPYLYVGPWTADRPGEAAFWNAPFGALVTRSALGNDPIGAGTAFLLDGLARLA